LVGCIICTYQHGGNKMAKYELRKLHYNTYLSKDEYYGEHLDFNTFAELKDFIIKNKNSEMVWFGHVYKNDEYLFSPESIFDYIEDAKYWQSQYVRTKTLGLKSLLEYTENQFSIKYRNNSL